MKDISLNAFDLLSANIFRKFCAIARYTTSTFFEICSKPTSKSFQSNY